MYEQDHVIFGRKFRSRITDEDSSNAISGSLFFSFTLKEV